MKKIHGKGAQSDISTRMSLWASKVGQASHVSREPYRSAVPTASHIGVFGEEPGEGVFAKTPSPETLTSRPGLALAAIGKMFQAAPTSRVLRRERGLPETRRATRQSPLHPREVIPTSYSSLSGGHAGSPYKSAVLAASHIGVFGEGPGEGVFAKTSSPETLTSRPSVLLRFPTSLSLPEPLRIRLVLPRGRRFCLCRCCQGALRLR